MKKLKKLVILIKSYFPTALPVGLTEFNIWVADIIFLADHLADEDSMRYAAANMIMHLGPTKSSVPKQYFVTSLRKAAANQVASSVFNDIRTRQKAAEVKAAEAKAAAEEQKITEATVLLAEASDEQKDVQPA